MDSITVQQLQTKVGNMLHGTNINEVPNFYDLCYSAVARLRARLDFRSTIRTSILTVGTDVNSYIIPRDVDMNKVTDFQPYYTRYTGDFYRPQNIVGNEWRILMQNNGFNIHNRNGLRELELKKPINNTYVTLFNCNIQNSTVDSATQITLQDGRVLTNADGMTQPESLVLDPYATKMATTLLSNEIVIADETDGGGEDAIYGVNQWGQGFTTGSTTSLLSGFTFRMKATAPTSPLQVQIFVASAGVPTGAAISTTTFQPGYFVDGEELKYTHLFSSDIGVNPSTQYVIVFSSTGAANGEYMLQNANVDNYPYGDAIYSSDSGSSFTVLTSQDEKVSIYEVGTAGVDGTGIGSFTLSNISPGFNLEGMKQVAKFRIFLTTQQSNNINKITFRFGTDNANYWESSTTTTVAGGKNEARPNIYELDWGTPTGDPDPTNIIWMQVIVEYNGTVDPVYFLDIKALLGTKFELSYYSKYWFKSEDGTYLMTPQSPTDELMLDSDEVEIFVNMLGMIVLQQLQGSDDGADMAYLKNVLFNPEEGLIPLYEENNPSQTMYQQIPVYQFNNGGWGNQEGDRINYGQNPDAGNNYPNTV